jgi:farnesyl-diphosphate farnesyltransferase
MTQVTDVTGELLKSVSRSFYLTIRFLPKQMRPAVALGYMLARATDSVADTAGSAGNNRYAIFQLTHNSLLCLYQLARSP